MRGKSHWEFQILCSIHEKQENPIHPPPAALCSQRSAGASILEATCLIFVEFLKNQQLAVQQLEGVLVVDLAGGGVVRFYFCACLGARTRSLLAPPAPTSQRPPSPAAPASRPCVLPALRDGPAGHPAHAGGGGPPALPAGGRRRAPGAGGVPPPLCAICASAVAVASCL